jgi:hypothetical protein
VSWLLNRLICWWYGHDYVQHFEPGRLSLVCVSCGESTPGWEIKKKVAR